LPSSVLEPLWVQVSALLPARQVHHPLGCHRPRIPDRIVFDKLIQRWSSAADIAASPTPPARRPPAAAPG
jgi:transposase